MTTRPELLDIPWLDTSEMAHLGPTSRPGVLSTAKIRSDVDRVCQPLSVSGIRRKAVLAAVLLWHDHLEASHEISQGIANPDGSFIHAIMHRREPDYWNSKYWWRQTGTHPIFPSLGEYARDHLRSSTTHGLERKLIRSGSWDPVAFVDACEEASRVANSDPQVMVLRDLQYLEFRTLLSHLLRG